MCSVHGIFGSQCRWIYKIGINLKESKFFSTSFQRILKSECRQNKRKFDVHFIGQWQQSNKLITHFLNPIFRKRILNDSHWPIFLHCVLLFGQQQKVFIIMEYSIEIVIRSSYEFKSSINSTVQKMFCCPEKGERVQWYTVSIIISTSKQMYKPIA